MITLSSFKDILISKSGGKPLSKVSNFYSIAYQAMTKMKARVDIPSAMRTVQLTNPVYSDVKLYPLPADMGLNAIVNLRPIVPDVSYYDFSHLNQRQLKNEVKFSPVSPLYGVRNINGVQYLMINEETTEPIVVQSCDSLTAMGAVNLLGTATDLAVDELQKVTGGGSFSFGVAAGATNGIDGTLDATIDLSEQNDLLAYVFLPTLTNVTGVQLGFGQSNTDYFTGSTAVDFFGNALAVGWNLVRIPKSSFAIGAGAPSWSGVAYWRYRVLGTMTVATGGFRIDSIVANIGALFEIDYYSDYQFATAAGARTVKPANESDLIIISGDEIDLYTDQFIEIMAVDLKQQGVNVEYQVYGGNNLKANYEAFKMKFPSQRQLMTTTYGSRPQGRVNE